MRNLFITILAVICLTSVHSQDDLTGNWTIDWQNIQYPTACVPQYFTLANDTTATVLTWNAVYTYGSEQEAVCSPSPTGTDSFTENSQNPGTWTDSFGRTITYTASSGAISFTSTDSSLHGDSYYYQKNGVNPVSQASAFGTLASNWTTPVNNSQDSCCAPDVISFLPSTIGSGLDLLYSATFYSNNICTAGQNTSNVNLTLFASTPGTASWVNTSPDGINVVFDPTAQNLSTVTVSLNTSSSPYACSYTYTRLPAPSSVPVNTWNQDWQTTDNASFPTQYIINSTNVSQTIQYLTSEYTLNSASEVGYVVETQPNQYTDTTLGQTFAYDSNTQTLLTGNFLYSLTGSLLKASDFVNFWGGPTPGENDTCCTPSYIQITAISGSDNTLSVAYTLPEDYASNSACSNVAGVTDYVVTSTLKISQPSITQLQWIDGLGNTITGNSSQISATFNSQCTFTMDVTAPLPPVITTGTYNVAWQNNDYSDLCAPLSITLTQDNYNKSVSVSYSYSNSVSTTKCPSNLLTTDTFSYTESSNTFTDTSGRAIVFANSIINFTPQGASQSIFYQQGSAVIQQQPTLGGLGTSWNSPTPVSGSSTTGCCPPDTITFIPSATGISYSTAFTSGTCTGTSVSNVALILYNSNTTTISYVDSTTSQNINVQYQPQSSETTLTATLNPNTCVYTYERVNVAQAIANTWYPDWQSVSSSAFNNPPNPYTITTSTTPTNDLTYMTSQYSDNSDSITSYVVQTGNTQYTDGTLNQVFTYDSNSHSLLTGTFLYSLNGSLFSPDPFQQLWGTPQASGDNCCIPTYINITANPNNNNSLSATYTLPEGYDSSDSQCKEFVAYFQDGGVMETTLVIQQPSYTQLTWVDQSTSITIAFTSAGDSSSISAVIPNQCTVNMVVTSPPSPTPTPTPVPLSASWISTKVIGMVMGLFMVLAWF